PPEFRVVKTKPQQSLRRSVLQRISLSSFFRGTRVDLFLLTATVTGMPGRSEVLLSPRPRDAQQTSRKLASGLTIRSVLACRQAVSCIVISRSYVPYSVECLWQLSVERRGGSLLGRGRSQRGPREPRNGLDRNGSFFMLVPSVLSVANRTCAGTRYRPLEVGR